MSTSINKNKSIADEALNLANSMTDISRKGNLNLFEFGAKLLTDSCTGTVAERSLGVATMLEPCVFLRLILRTLRLLPKFVKETLSVIILQRKGEFILAYFSSSTSS